MNGLGFPGVDNKIQGAMFQNFATDAVFYNLQIMLLAHIIIKARFMIILEVLATLKMELCLSIAWKCDLDFGLDKFILALFGLGYENCQ